MTCEMNNLAIEWNFVFSPNVILCGWLGSKHRPINKLTLATVEVFSFPLATVEVFSFPVATVEVFSFSPGTVEVFSFPYATVEMSFS